MLTGGGGEAKMDLERGNFIFMLDSMLFLSNNLTLNYFFISFVTENLAMYASHAMQRS